MKKETMNLKTRLVSSIIIYYLLAFNSIIYPANSSSSTNWVTVEMFANDKKVIPLAFKYGDYHCIHVKPPKLIIRNISTEDVTITAASMAGRLKGLEITRFTIYKNQIEKLMIICNKQINKYLSALDDSEMSYKLMRIYGKPTLTKIGYTEGNKLPFNGYAMLDLSGAFLFVQEGIDHIDELEIRINVENPAGVTSTVNKRLPFIHYTCQNKYFFPIQGTCVMGSLPIGQNHRFANSQEFAIDILDIRRNEDGSFSTCGIPSPMVIMGSDKVSDYYIFNREVLAIADGKVLEVSNGYPDEFAGNPQEPITKRNERLKKHLLNKANSIVKIPDANFVFIDHGNCEFARYCHLQENITVKPGDTVKQGDVIGYVGNSGFSMEPHLHLELLDSPDYKTANGLPIVFCDLNLANALESPGFGMKNSPVFSEFIFVFNR